MSVTITVTLTDREAEAVLKSEGFSNGHGVRIGAVLGRADHKIITAIQGAWNANIEAKEAQP